MYRKDFLSGVRIPYFPRNIWKSEVTSVEETTRCAKRAVETLTATKKIKGNQRNSKVLRTWVEATTTRIYKNISGFTDFRRS